MFEPNTDQTTKSRYPYLPIITKEYMEVAYDPDTLEPLCAIPTKARSWACQFMVAIVISRLSNLGVKKSEIRKEAEARARRLNQEHCGGTTLIKTIQNAVRRSMRYQAAGQNTWSVPNRVEELDGRLVLVFRYPRGSKAKGW